MASVELKIWQDKWLVNIWVLCLVLMTKFSLQCMPKCTIICTVRKSPVIQYSVLLVIWTLTFDLTNWYSWNQCNNSDTENYHPVWHQMIITLRIKTIASQGIICASIFVADMILCIITDTSLQIVIWTRPNWRFKVKWTEGQGDSAANR